MRVRDVMTAPAVTVRVETPLKDALALLDAKRITSLPVVTASGKVIGVVGEADLVREAVLPDVRFHVHEAPRETTMLPATTVGEVMSRRPILVFADDDLAEATEMMAATAVKSLPVVDEQRRVVGVVSRRDVVHVLARPDAILAADLSAQFERLGLDWLVEVNGGVATVTGPLTEQEVSMAIAAASSVPGITGALADHPLPDTRRRAGPHGVE